MAGKGDTYRKVDWRKWSRNYDRAFGHNRRRLAKRRRGR